MLLLPATLLKKGLTENPRNNLVCVIATLLKKDLTENPEKRLSLRLLSPNPIGAINRRNGCGTTLLKKGLTENLNNKVVGVINCIES